LKSEFLAEVSVLGFHVAAGNRGVFIHQYSSILGTPTFSTRSADCNHSPNSAPDPEQLITNDRIQNIALSSGNKPVPPMISNYLITNPMLRINLKPTAWNLIGRYCRVLNSIHINNLVGVDIVFLGTYGIEQHMIFPSDPISSALVYLERPGRIPKKQRSKTSVGCHQ